MSDPREEIARVERHRESERAIKERMLAIAQQHGVDVTRLNVKGREQLIIDMLAAYRQGVPFEELFAQRTGRLKHCDTCTCS